MSAVELAARIKPYLNEPDKRFRRVKDKFGHLHLSKNALAYSPERGVYRSSARNAQRLARTEINMAYRTAEQLRWSQMDFVVGYEVKTTQNGKHVTDICDDLAGKYPKDFQFKGWHPHCMCYALPILKTEEEFLALDDKPSVNAVTDVPDNFKQWVRDNSDRIISASEKGKLPYFLRDNFDSWGRVIYPEKYAKKSKKSIQERAKERHAQRTEEDIKRIQDSWSRRLLANLYVESDRIGAFQDPTLRDFLNLLDVEIYLKDYTGFKRDYKEVVAYIKSTIESETIMARTAMGDKLFAENIAKLASELGIKQGDFMTFFEADELRGNPHYLVDAIYRTNCQTAVVVNELRRRGFNVQAMGNTEGSLLDMLSKSTNNIWRDKDNNIPQKTIIGAQYKNGRWKKTAPNRKQLIHQLESSITEDGRYHIDWIWKGSGLEREGHIITIEKIGDTLRYYDPQTGIIIKDFYGHIDKIDLSRGIRMLRVDNLRIDTNWASKIVAKAGAKAERGKAIGKGGVTGFSIKEDVAEYVKNRNKASSYKDKVALDKEMVNNPRFIRSDKHSTKNGSIFATEELPNKITAENQELSKNIMMAKKMANNGYDVYLLSNPHGVTSADFILSKNGKVFYVEGKLSTGKNSLGHNLSKGGSQAERIVIDLTGTNDTNYITARLSEGFQNNQSIKEVLLLKGGRLISIDNMMISRKDFKRYFKKVWEQKK